MQLKYERQCTSVCPAGAHLDQLRLRVCPVFCKFNCFLQGFVIFPNSQVVQTVASAETEVVPQFRADGERRAPELKHNYVDLYVNNALCEFQGVLTNMSYKIKS